MKNFFKHVRVYIFRGILASIPLFLSYLVIKFIYLMIDKRANNLLEPLIGYRIPFLGILLVLVILYLVGFAASNVIGRQFFNLLGGIASRIPIVKTTYQVGKQLSSTLSLPEKQIFKRVVLVECLKSGIWTIGFVTGTILDKRNHEKLLKVFVPTVPNPTTGFIFLLKESQTIDPGWSVEQAIKAVISGGIIGPEEIEK